MPSTRALEVRIADKLLLFALVKPLNQRSYFKSSPLRCAAGDEPYLVLAVCRQWEPPKCRAVSWNVGMGEEAQPWRLGCKQSSLGTAALGCQ